MSIFLNWNDIDDDDKLAEAKERVRIEAAQIDSNKELTFSEKLDAKFDMKQCVIRCYSYKPPVYSFD